MRRRVALATCTMLIGGGVAAGVVGAQQAPRTVTITIGPRSVAVEGAENLPAGPTRVVFRSTGREIEGVLAALRPGRTLAELRRALPRSQNSPRPVKRIISFEASAGPARGQTYATTIDLRAGATYVAANIPRNIRNARLATFTVGTTPGGAVRPTPVTTVGMYDYAFGMPDTLPRRGIVRFENRGQRLHMAFAVAVRRGTNRAALVQALLRGQERRFERLGDFARSRELVGVVSGGTVNDVEVNLPRRGDYVLVCFIEDGERGNPAHFSLGMAKAFRAR